MNSIIDVLREVLGTPDFYKQMTSNGNYTWDYAAMMEYFFAGLILCIRRIYKTVGIDKNTHQIIDRYAFGSFLTNFIGADNHRLFLRNGYYRYFNSYSTPTTPTVPAKPLQPLKTSFLMKLRYLRTYIRRGKKKLKTLLKQKMKKKKE